MKKAAMFTLLAAFIIGGVTFNSCKKDTVQDVNTTTQNPVLKDAMGLNIMMGQSTDIGDVDIYVTYPTLFVDIELDEAALDGYAVVEAHLWASTDAPPYPQSLFPNYWDIDMGPFPGSWSFDLTGYNYGTEVICWDLTTIIAYDFNWYFALHLQLEKVVSEPVLDESGEPVLDEFGNPMYEDVTYEETAWVLNAGTNWLNKKGKPMGWGEYFQVNFTQACPPEQPI
jgi:hypothetical protein